MKKMIWAIVIAVMFLPVSVFAAGTASTAAYASVTPVIDGQIDDIWNYTEAQSIPDGSDITGAYTKILWDEKGLYFLAVAADKSITQNDAEARNSVDFWVSEKNTKTSTYTADSGDWHFCKASDGTEKYYTGNAEVYNVGQKAAVLTDNGYIIEMFIPYMSDIDAKQGAIIGYTVSINDDTNNDGTRDEYVYWGTSEADSAYWENTAALLDIELTAGPDSSVFAPAQQEPAAPNTAAPKTFDAAAISALLLISSAAALVITRKIGAKRR